VVHWDRADQVKEKLAGMARGDVPAAATPGTGSTISGQIALFS
jgi:hypothetical protein